MTTYTVRAANPPAMRVDLIDDSDPFRTVATCSIWPANDDGARLDAIVLERHQLGRVVLATVLGKAAPDPLTAPEPPTIPDGWEILAWVNVPRASAVIYPSQITETGGAQTGAEARS